MRRKQFFQKKKSHRHHPRAAAHQPQRSVSYDYRNNRNSLLGRARGLLARAFDQVCAWLGDPAATQRLADARRSRRRRYLAPERPRPGRYARGPYPQHFVPSAQSWPWRFMGREAPWPPAPGSYYPHSQLTSPDVPNRGPFAGRGPRNYTRPDARIFEDINEALTYSPHVDASDIDVRVHAGEVTVSGSVDDRYVKRLVEDLIEDVTGVRDIRNDLRIERQPPHVAGGVDRSQRHHAPQPRADRTSGQGFDEAEASTLNTASASAQRDEDGNFSGT